MIDRQRGRVAAAAASWERALAGAGIWAVLALGGAAIAQDDGLAGDPPVAVSSEAARSGVVERGVRLRARYDRWQRERVAPERLIELPELPELPPELEALLGASAPAEVQP